MHLTVALVSLVTATHATHYGNETKSIIGPFGEVSPNLAASVVSANPCTTIFDLSCATSCLPYDPKFIRRVTQYQTSFKWDGTSQIDYTPTTTTATGCTNSSSTSALGPEHFLTVHEECTLKGPLPTFTGVVCTNTLAEGSLSTTYSYTVHTPSLYSQATISVTAGATLPIPGGEECLTKTAPIQTSAPCSESGYALKWAA